MLEVLFGILVNALGTLCDLAVIHKWWDIPACWLLGKKDRIGDYLRDRWQSITCRRKAGRCLMCGYNLFQNTTGICPECGTPIHENRC